MIIVPAIYSREPVQGCRVLCRSGFKRRCLLAAETPQRRNAIACVHTKLPFRILARVRSGLHALHVRDVDVCRVETRSDGLPGKIDDLSTFRRRHSLPGADILDAAIAHQDHSVFERNLACAINDAASDKRSDVGCAQDRVCRRENGK